MCVAGKSRPGSVAPPKSVHAATKAGSVAGSHASYPHTPARSEAGESVTSSVIASRLHRLEQVHELHAIGRLDPWHGVP